MARWLISLALALLAALALHGVALWGISQELQAMHSVVAPHADPMFTRQITQATVAAGPAPAILMPKQAVAQQNIAGAAPKSVVSKAKKTALQKPPPEGEPEPLAPEPMPTVVLSTPTDTVLATSPFATPSSTLAASLTAVQAGVDGAAGATAQASNAHPSATLANSSADVHAASGHSAALALQGEWPADTRLSYQLGGYYRGDLHGNAQVQWTRPPAAEAQPNDRYQVRINISLGLAKAQLTSQGRVRATGLQPQAYEEQLPTRGPRSVKLDAQDVLLTDGRRIPRPAQDLSPVKDLSLVQDTASQFVDLGYRFSTGRAVLKEGEAVKVWLARPGGLDEWIYDIGPPETIYLPLMGAVQAHHLKPRPLVTARGTITAEMWIAPGLQHLPVRIKITLNKEAHLDLLVQKIEQR
jgi:Protein of unknown function (DUF3108)